VGFNSVFEGLSLLATDTKIVLLESQHNANVTADRRSVGSNAGSCVTQ